LHHLLLLLLIHLRQFCLQLHQIPQFLYARERRARQIRRGSITRRCLPSGYRSVAGHFTASTLTSAGVEDNIISLLTGHKSRELRRYQHLREELKRRTVNVIAGVLKEADKKGASSSRLLHTRRRKTKSKKLSD